MSLKDQMSEFWIQMKAGRINSANLQAFIDNPNAVFAGMLEKVLGMFEIKILDSNINSTNFPVAREPDPDEEVIIVDMKGPASSDEVKAHMDKEGLVPAEVEYCAREAGKMSPEELAEHPLVCLAGSGWTSPYGLRYVPVFHAVGGGRCVRLLSWDAYQWPEYCRFPARRK